MKDNEIIKALECCTTTGASCKDCPAFVKVDRSNCKKFFKGAIDLINRQQAEIEALIAGQETLQKNLPKVIRYNTIKEFDKKFRKKIKDVGFTLGQTWEINSALGEVVKEMTEGNGNA